ncbi:cellulase family glycosylhydrolase [bacterium]|nr:cellulase family glycosylhydrolase [bacterium]
MILPRIAMVAAMTASGFIPFDCRCNRPSPPPDTPGLTVARDGTLRKGGTPYRGIGVNYFDCFARTLRNPSDTSYDAGFATLARMGIPFCRLMACPFWPAEYKLYREDRTDYFARLDGVVRSAEKHGIGLIPSLFWHSPSVPDLVGEPRDQWGNPQSKTHDFLRTYVAEVVARYKASPAIWGWEFGNEYNLDADLPNAATHRPKIVPDRGTPTSRSARDDLTHGHIATAFAAFAREVRRHDPHRALFTGNSAPRPSAWHQWKEKSWTQDTPAQYAERLVADNPDPIDTLTVHIYWDTAKRFAADTSVDAFLQHTLRAASKERKALFVGEFGASAGENESHDVVVARLSRILAAIEASDVPLAALWVYDFQHQDLTWNITATNARAYQLEAIAAANRRLQAK